MDALDAFFNLAKAKMRELAEEKDNHSEVVKGGTGVMKAFCRIRFDNSTILEQKEEFKKRLLGQCKLDKMTILLCVAPVARQYCLHAVSISYYSFLFCLLPQLFNRRILRAFKKI